MITFELRKLATVVMAVAVIGMMAACSGPSPSTDDALSNTGDTYLGSFRFDVNPQAESVDITPIGSPFTSNKILGNGNVKLKSLPAGCYIANSQSNTSWALIAAINCTTTTSGANGTLTYTNATSKMKWQAPNDTEGPETVVAIGGTYKLLSGTAGSITVYIPTTKPTADKIDNNLVVFSPSSSGCFIATDHPNTKWAQITTVTCTPNQTGTAGTLSYINSTSQMTWQAPNDTVGTAVTVANGGTYTLPSGTSGNSLTVHVTTKPTADASDHNLLVQQSCFVANSQNNTSWAKILGVSCDDTHTGKNGSLRYANIGSTMKWQAPNDSLAGSSVTVANGNTYTLASNDPSYTITVYVIQKPTANKSDTNLNVQKYIKWDSGTGTLDFNTKFTWSDPNYELYNVRVGPNQSTNLNVQTTNSMKCNLAWSSCIPGNDPAITYVADTSADGPVTFRACNQSGGGCKVNAINAIHAGCGSIMAHWTLTENTGAPYHFWSTVYGDPHIIGNTSYPLTGDPFYDPLTSSIYIRTFKLGAGSENPPEGLAATTMGPGEWFYVHFYVDSSGNNSPWTFDATLPPVGQGDKHSEDVGNIAAWAGGTNNGANYWTIGQVEYSVKFDPAIIELNASNTNDGPGTGAAPQFTTAEGTVLMRVYDSNQGGSAAADGYDFTSPVGTVASNKMGILYSQGQIFNATNGFLPSPCGLMPGNNCNAADGFANIDLDIGYIPLRVRSTAVAGQGSFLHIAYDTYTNITYFITNSLPYQEASWTSDGEGPRSANWPTWCSDTPGSSCRTTGQYNGERAYICVQ